MCAKTSIVASPEKSGGPPSAALNTLLSHTYAIGINVLWGSTLWQAPPEEEVLADVAERPLDLSLGFGPIPQRAGWMDNSSRFQLYARFKTLRPPAPKSHK